MINRALNVAALTLAACGGSSQQTVDATPPDPDAAGGTVSVTVTSNVYHSTFIEVYFQRADSLVLATVDIKEGETAQATMEAGGFVTVVNPFGRKDPTDALFTFTGVKPGDHLTLDEKAIESSTMTVIAPNDPGATSYFVGSTCGTGGSLTATGTAPATGLAGFSCTGTVDLAVITSNADGTTRNMMIVPDVTIVPDGTLDLTTRTYATTSATAVDYVHVPSQDIPILRSVRTNRGGMVVAAELPTVVDGSVSSNVRIPADTTLVTQSVFRIPMSRRTVVDWGIPTGDTTLDADQVLPAAYTSFPTYDEPNHVVRWTTGPETTKPDVTRAAVYASLGNRFWNWQVVGPYTDQTLALPTLPTNLLDVSHSDSSGVAELATAKLPGGYDAIREHAFAFQDLDDAINGPQGRIVSQTMPRPSGAPF